MDKMRAIQQAVDEIQQVLAQADGAELMAKRKPGTVAVTMETEGDMPEECKAGMCEHPEHMSDEDMGALSEEY